MSVMAAAEKTPHYRLDIERRHDVVLRQIAHLRELKDRHAFSGDPAQERIDRDLRLAQIDCIRLESILAAPV